MARKSLNSNSLDEAEDIEKILAIVVKRRKTIPEKCMEFHKRMTEVELQAMENSTVICQKNASRENFKRIIQGAKRLRHVPFSIHDLNKAEKRLQNSYKRVKEINSYLEKVKKQKT